MSPETRRELRLLKGYALITTALLGTLSIAAFRQAAKKTRFAEIDVERINVVEPDGKLRLVISNRARSIGPIYKGKPFGYPGGTRPGLIFFNDEGTENGGLTRANGDRFRRMILSRGNVGDYAALYREFRGKDPSIEFMLKRRGITPGAEK